MTHRYHCIWMVCFLLLSIHTSAFGQFYKIYGYGTLDAGEWELVYWNSYIMSSDLHMDFFDEHDIEKEGLIAHSLEVEFGLSHKWTVAAYLDFYDPSDAELMYVRAKAVACRYRFYDKGSRPIDIGLYLEFKFPRKSFDDAEELEAKIILEKDVGSWTGVLNPTFEKKISGHDIEEGMEFNFSTGVYFRTIPWVEPGLEYYSKFGELRDFKSYDDQQHVLFPTIDFIIKMRYRLHTGIGIGLTDASDNLIWKTIFSVEFI